MIAAVSKGLDQKHKDLHDLERPTAMLTATYINSKRDPKKPGKAVSYLDLSFYKPRDNGQTANAVNGTAMVELAKLKLLPGWALFCFKEVTATADGTRPQTLAFVGSDAMLVAPSKTELGWTGLLIAEESASNQTRSLIDPESGENIRVKIPHIHTKVIAEEDQLLISAQI